MKTLLLLFITQLICLSNAHWNPLLQITSPPSLAGNYTEVGTASFSNAPDSPILAQVAISNPPTACTSLQGNYVGKFCLVEGTFFVIIGKDQYIYRRSVLFIRESTGL